jgi:hypothetical protein
MPEQRGARAAPGGAVANPAGAGPPALKRFTTLHYCELHKGELKVEDLLTRKLKRELEADARVERPHGFKCDFEKAGIDFVLPPRRNIANSCAGWAATGSCAMRWAD